VRENANRKERVSEPTLKRLPIYLHFLQKAKEGGLLTISAPLMAKELHADPTQIVKDLAVTGVKGRPRIGYNIYEVVQAIEEFLGFNKTQDAFLIGAGNLGSALVAYPEFRNFGLKIVAAFDSDKGKIGKSKSGINVLHIDKFPDLTKRLNVKIAVITTPTEAAQEVAEYVVDCGIQAIWNLTPVRLNVPEDIIVQNTSMYSNVAILLKKMQDKLANDSQTNHSN
jgi:redox-sensing transcriptional repressor